jgi:hypothetical protein
VIDAVPAPSVNVTEPGYPGALPLGLLDGPVKVTVLAPLRLPASRPTARTPIESTP